MAKNLFNQYKIKGTVKIFMNIYRTSSSPRPIKPYHLNQIYSHVPIPFKLILYLKKLSFKVQRKRLSRNCLIKKFLETPKKMFGSIIFGSGFEYSFRYFCQFFHTQIELFKKALLYKFLSVFCGYKNTASVEQRLKF
jgi:hypothetical protein